MPRMTTSEYYAHEAKMAAKTTSKPDTKTGCDDEAGLHYEIIQECKRNGWLYMHSDMSRNTTITPGCPDFIILCDPVLTGHHYETGPEFMIPRVLLIECKTRTGKQTPEQLQFAAHAKKLGHTVHVVRSFEEFCEVVK